MDSDNGDPTGGSGAIHLVSSRGGDVRTIVSDERSAGIYRGHPMWSPDGSLIAYGEWCDTDCSTGSALTVDGATVQPYIVKADGSPIRILPSPVGVQFQAPESWSNDGTSMLVIRGYTGGREEAFAAYFDQLQRFLTPAQPITLDDLEHNGLGRIVERYVHREAGRVKIVTYLYTTDPRFRRNPPPGLVEALQGDDPGIVVTGTNVAGRELRKIFLHDSRVAVVLGLVLVALLPASSVEITKKR
jgi:hypothetical protein